MSGTYEEFVDHPEGLTRCVGNIGNDEWPADDPDDPDKLSKAALQEAIDEVEPLLAIHSLHIATLEHGERQLCAGTEQFEDDVKEVNGRIDIDAGELYWRTGDHSGR